ncbi:hypothetical protein J7400_20850 [Shimia sp. R9_2]|uniref:hypothetical protein n=1 Tax=Shimia sp. R9_2 TaxID=2821112 RepID=UPI001ADAD42B|nr:hypothetical protein [Shimia sp. R9_2]MBO9399132.1 hypothetical protein [Shimia sp. R9_2]
MTKNVFSKDLISVEEIGEILRIIKSSRKWTVRAVYDALKANADAQGKEVCSERDLARTMQERGQESEERSPRLSQEKIGGLLSFISTTMNDDDWRQLASKNASLARRITAPNLHPANAMSHWLGSYAQNPPEIEKRSGENGKFLILRLDMKGGIISSFMQVFGASIASPLPYFQTIRKGDDGVPREVEGVIFASNGLFYSFGKSSLRDGFRATILKPLDRSDTKKNNRFDMFGVRLGQQDEPELPYAYPIYCYQLKRNRSEDEITKLTGKKSEDDDFMIEQIDGFQTILARLKAGANFEYGVLASTIRPDV